MARRRPDVTAAEATIINNVHTFFLEEKDRSRKLHARDTAEQTAAACGVSRRTVFNVRDRAGEPAAKRGGSLPLQVDEFTKSAIRERIRSFFLRKELPTVRKLLDDCRENIDDFPPMSVTSLWRLLKKMGFRYTKRTNKRQLYERHDVIAARAEYLRAIREYRRAGRPSVYLDETWCNQHHTVAKAWQDGESAPKDAPSGKGKRLIILHAGSANGWIPDAELAFVGKKDTSDYHGEMNQVHFEEWWEHDLLPNLPPMAVIVLDNAPYHNRRTDETIAPTSSSKKADIIARLQANNVPHNPGSLKAVLYTLVKQNKKKPKYVVDEVAGAQGFAVERLPVGHCELNPIELVWAHVKTHVAKNNTTYRMADVERLVREGIETATQDLWTRCCDHAVKVEEEFRTADALQEEAMEALIIQLPAGDNNDSSDDDEE